MAAFTLREASRAHGEDRRHGPPREGPALLQGLVLCGRCGLRMTVRYHQRRGQLVPDYVCQSRHVATGAGVCQTIAGGDIDEAVGQLLIEKMTPATLELAAAVQQELQQRWEQADGLRRQQVERARYEAELASRRYHQVDPDNRLVADELEGAWNNRLRALASAQEQYEQRRVADRAGVDEQQKQSILALANDVPALWHNPKTPGRERKRIVRLLLEDVTLLKGELLAVHVRFKGGMTQTLQLPRPQLVWQRHKTSEKVVKEIDRLLVNHTDTETAGKLNERGLTPGRGKIFNRSMVQRIRNNHGLKSRYDRLRDRGLLTLREIAEQLDVTPVTVKIWRRHGLLRGHRYNDKNQCLYDHPGDQAPTKRLGQKLSERGAVD